MEGRCLISERKDRSIILILGKPQTCRSARSIQISHNTFFPFSFVGTVKKRSGRRREGGGRKRRDFSRGGGVSFFLFVRQGFVVLVARHLNGRATVVCLHVEIFFLEAGSAELYVDSF